VFVVLICGEYVKSIRKQNIGKTFVLLYFGILGATLLDELRIGLKLVSKYSNKTNISQVLNLHC
jgi:hypothetical protein